MAIRFPMTLSAVQAAERNQCEALFRIGDALVAECGSTNTNPGHNGSSALVEACAAELAASGFVDYSTPRLNNLRYTATAYPSSRRRYDLSFGIHEDAGNPDVLDAVIADSPRGQTITQRYVRNTVRLWRDEEAMKQRLAAQEAADVAVRRQRNASSPTERRAAERDEEIALQRARSYTPPSRREFQPPPPEERPAMHSAVHLLGRAHEASSLADRAARDLREAESLSEKSLAAIFEAATEAVEAWRRFGEAVRERQKTKDSHLRVI